MDDAPLLRISLRANAVFSVLSGALAVREAEPVAPLVSLPGWAITEIGWVLVGYGVALMVLSRRRRVLSAWTVVATLLDFTWVAGSALFLGLREVGGPLLWRRCDSRLGPRTTAAGAGDNRWSSANRR